MSRRGTRDGLREWAPFVISDLAASLSGLAMAAILFDGVHLAGVGAAAAAALVLAAFGWTFVVLMKLSARHRSTWSVPVLFVGPLTFAIGLVVAAWAVSGFDIRGLWAYLGTLAILCAINLVFDWTERRINPQPRGEPVEVG